jgi:hypothetical protein
MANPEEARYTGAPGRGSDIDPPRRPTIYYPQSQLDLAAILRVHFGITAQHIRPLRSDRA